MDRAHRSFWILTGVTILATGIFSRALVAPAGPVSDVVVASSALLLAMAGALTVRVLRALTRAGRAAGQHGERRD